MSIKTNHKKFWAYNYIFDVLGNKLKPNGIAVYLCLIRHANNQSQCYPSFKLIAEKCGMSRMTVIRTIDKLIGLDLIQVQKRKSNKGDYSSNLYTIKELPETSDKIDTQRVVSESDHPSITELPPVVSESDHPSLTKLPEGQPTEGKLYLKDDETKDEQSINNHTNCNTNTSSSFDEGLSELNSPINLSQQAVKALSLLQDNNKRQEVLDVLAASMTKGTIRKPEAYLQTLIQRCLDGDFTPLKNSIPEKIDSKFIQNLEYNTNLSLEQKTEIFEKYRRQKINDCPYCDASGYIRFLEEDGDMYGKVCTHEKIERLPSRVVKIVTAKPDYQQPGTQGLTHISELNVIKSLRERFSERLGDEQCDFEVPF
jgi:DNA-binding GntR family transcriptional regulator